MKDIITILLLNLMPFVLAGQACCSGGTPLSGSLGLQNMEAGGGLVELNYDYNTQHDLVAGAEELGDNPRRRNTHSLLLRAGYAFNERWTLLGIFSWIRQEEVTQRQSGGKGLKEAQGIGDAVLFGQYNLLTNSSLSLLLGAGAEIPVGGTGRVDAETGLPLHPDLQPGRGAWAFLGGARLTLFQVLRPTTSFTSNLTYRLTTPADRYQGLQEYEFGNELRLLTGFADRFTLGTTFFDPSLLLLYRHTVPDKTNGFDTPNTGGHWVHFRPGFEWVLGPGFQVGAFGEMPLYRNLKGTQLTTTARVRVTFRYTFQTGSSFGLE